MLIVRLYTRFKQSLKVLQSHAESIHFIGISTHQERLVCNELIKQVWNFMVWWIVYFSFALLGTNLGHCKSFPTMSALQGSWIRWMNNELVNSIRLINIVFVLFFKEERYMEHIPWNLVPFFRHNHDRPENARLSYMGHRQKGNWTSFPVRVWSARHNIPIFLGWVQVEHKPVFIFDNSHKKILQTHWRDCLQVKQKIN